MTSFALKRTKIIYSWKKKTKWRRERDYHGLKTRKDRRRRQRQLGSSPVAPGRLVEAAFPGILVGVFHDLGLEVILVGEDVAFPLGHPLLLANPDLIGHLQGGKQELSLDPILKCNKARPGSLNLRNPVSFKRIRKVQQQWPLRRSCSIFC